MAPPVPAVPVNGRRGGPREVHPVTSAVRDPGGCPGTGPGPRPARGTGPRTTAPRPTRRLTRSRRSWISPRVPVHVACVMDGNGRWAKARGLPRTEGHGAGETALLDVVNGALEIGIKWITLYAFSTENWRRPPDEVRYLMNFNQSLLMRRPRRAQREGGADPLRRPAGLAGAPPGCSSVWTSRSSSRSTTGAW